MTEIRKSRSGRPSVSAADAAVGKPPAAITAPRRARSRRWAQCGDSQSVADPDVPVQRWHAELLDSARLEAFARWLNSAMHERVRLVHGLEHPGEPPDGSIGIGAPQGLDEGRDGVVVGVALLVVADEGLLEGRGGGLLGGLVLPGRQRGRDRRLHGVERHPGVTPGSVDDVGDRPVVHGDPATAQAAFDQKNNKIIEWGWDTPSAYVPGSMPGNVSTFEQLPFDGVALDLQKNPPLGGST